MCRQWRSTSPDCHCSPIRQHASLPDSWYPARKSPTLADSRGSNAQARDFLLASGAYSDDRSDRQFTPHAVVHHCERSPLRKRIGEIEISLGVEALEWHPNKARDALKSP